MAAAGVEAAARVEEEAVVEVVAEAAAVSIGLRR
jgi:hypothetical protein